MSRKKSLEEAQQRYKWGNKRIVANKDIYENYEDYVAGFHNTTRYHYWIGDTTFGYDSTPFLEGLLWTGTNAQ